MFEQSTFIKNIKLLIEDHSRFFFSSAITLPIQQRRLEVIQSRILTLAWIFLFTIPLWSLIDAAAFPSALWWSFLKARVLTGLASAAFIAFGDKIYKIYPRKLWVAYIQLAIIFIIPTLLYVFCIRIPSTISETTPLAVAITNSYYLLPVVIVACLGYFPLTPIESSCIVMPFLTAYYLTTPFSDVVFQSSDFGMIWVIFLLAVVSIVISYTQLRMLGQIVTISSHDVLTNCLGRRSGEDVLRALWHYSVRQKSHLAIAFLDLDHFKKVNDVFGHQVGDQVLTEVAAKLRSSLRNSDFIIRWGGEEFLIVMPDANLDNATAVIARLAGKGLGLRPDGSPQTVSIGVAERIHENTENETDLIKIADDRLYQAKSSGRSRVVSTHTIAFMTAS